MSKNAPEILKRDDGNMLFKSGVPIASSGGKGLKSYQKIKKYR
jgi:hypothetical protein